MYKLETPYDFDDCCVVHSRNVKEKYFSVFMILHFFIRLLTSLFVFLTLPLCQVQIQEQQGQTVGQVLQVAHPSQQDIQGFSTAQLVQAGELTEEQQQQVED